MTQDDKKPSVDSLIDQNLRRVYETVLNEDVPDRFTALLDQLRASEGGDGGSGDPLSGGATDRDAVDRSDA